MSILCGVFIGYVLVPPGLMDGSCWEEVLPSEGEKEMSHLLLFIPPPF